METIQRLSPFFGRLLIAAVFVIAGGNKILGYEGTQGYMDAMGMSGN